MVKKVEKEDKTYYECEECNMFYNEEAWAKKCEKWCGEKHSCNLEITKYAIEI